MSVIEMLIRIKKYNMAWVSAVPVLDDFSGTLPLVRRRVVEVLVGEKRQLRLRSGKGIAKLKV